MRSRLITMTARPKVVALPIIFGGAKGFGDGWRFLSTRVRRKLVQPYPVTAWAVCVRCLGGTLQQLGGTLAGDWRYGPTPSNTRTLAELESTTLTEVIRYINKFSNNVMARNLLLSIASEAGAVPATPAQAESLIKTWLAENGIAMPQLHIDNGAGLSRDARVTAEDWQSCSNPRSRCLTGRSFSRLAAYCDSRRLVKKTFSTLPSLDVFG